jgi:hypothetical protein
MNMSTESIETKRANMVAAGALVRGDYIGSLDHKYAALQAVAVFFDAITKDERAVKQYIWLLDRKKIRRRPNPTNGDLMVSIVRDAFGFYPGAIEEIRDETKRKEWEGNGRKSASLLARATTYALTRVKPDEVAKFLAESHGIVACASVARRGDGHEEERFKKVADFFSSHVALGEIPSPSLPASGAGLSLAVVTVTTGGALQVHGVVGATKKTIVTMAEKLRKQIEAGAEAKATVKEIDAAVEGARAPKQEAPLFEFPSGSKPGPRKPRLKKSNPVELDPALFEVVTHIAGPKMTPEEVKRLASVTVFDDIRRLAKNRRPKGKRGPVSKAEIWTLVKPEDLQSLAAQH